MARPIPTLRPGAAVVARRPLSNGEYTVARGATGVILKVTGIFSTSYTVRFTSRRGTTVIGGISPGHLALMHGR